VDRAIGAVRGELNDEGRSYIESPTEFLVELLRAVHIGDGNDDDLDFHVHPGEGAGVVFEDFGLSCGGFFCGLGLGHFGIPFYGLR